MASREPSLNVPPEAVTAARALSRSDVVSVSRASGGGNNGIFRVVCADGDVYALKHYPRQDEDTRDRITREWRAISLVSGDQAQPVPRPIAWDPEARFSLFEWIDGDRPAPTVDAVDTMAAFLNGLQNFARKKVAASIGPASAACFSGADVVAQLTRRRARLSAARGDDVGLADFLSRQVDPAIGLWTDAARQQYEAIGMDFDRPLDATSRCLSPSDFGLHNALRRSDGRIVFLDFEYFGWDDPVKAVSDVVLHPGSAFPAPLAQRFVHLTAACFTAQDHGFPVRLKALYPLFSLIWCLIVLNEFLPERWARRVIAGEAGERAAILARQLDKARQCLNCIGNTDEIVSFAN